MADAPVARAVAAAGACPPRDGRPAAAGFPANGRARTLPRVNAADASDEMLMLAWTAGDVAAFE
ncbi:hypothetical protein ABTH82_18730, partial [Acinetobacter baumannii]